MANTQKKTFNYNTVRVDLRVSIGIFLLKFSFLLSHGIIKNYDGEAGEQNY